MEKSIEKIPTWSFGYIFNGDATGLTDEEVKMIDKVMHDLNVELVCTPLEASEPYFSSSPLFGLPSEVEDCIILYRNY